VDFDLKVFAERLNEGIRGSGLTFAAVARELGVSRSAVTQLRNGEIYPSVQTLCKLCRLLDVSSDWLAGLSDTRGRQP